VPPLPSRVSRPSGRLRSQGAETGAGQGGDLRVVAGAGIGDAQVLAQGGGDDVRVLGGQSHRPALLSRRQVALLLRSLGYTPGNFDMLLYDAETRNAQAW